MIGEDEVAQGKVKIKEMGLEQGHPEKDGVLVDLANIVPEMQERLRRKARLDSLVQDASGLKVADEVKAEPKKLEAEKPTEEIPPSQEATGAVPAP